MTSAGADAGQHQEYESAGIRGPFPPDTVWWLPDGRVLSAEPPLTYCLPHPVVKRKRGEPEPFADLCPMCFERFYAMPMRRRQP